MTGSSAIYPVADIINEGAPRRGVPNGKKDGCYATRVLKHEAPIAMQVRHAALTPAAAIDSPS